MALIKVGIHENLSLSAKTKINEHGTLELVIGTVESETALMDAIMNNTVIDKMESSLRFYPPSLTDFEKNKKSAADIGKELLVMRYQFMQYALLFSTEEVVNKELGGVAFLEGLGIVPADYPKALTMLNKEDFLKKVCKNLAEKFLDFLKKVDAFNGKTLFRHKFLRQSKDKNFAVIPNSTFDTWVEPMTVPAEQSKIAFSQWEIDNGKNDPNPGKSDKSQSSKKDAKTAENLFGDNKDEVVDNEADGVVENPTGAVKSDEPTPDLFGGADGKEEEKSAE